MFNKLKEKLSSFKKVLSKKIDEKAVPVEPSVAQGSEKIEEEIPSEIFPEEEQEEIPSEILPEEKLQKKEVSKPAGVSKTVHVPEKHLKKGHEAEIHAEKKGHEAAGKKPVSSETQAEKNSFFKKPKISFTQKAKALVFNREVYLDSKDLEAPLWELEMALLESDLAVSVSEAIVESVKNELVGTKKHIGGDTGAIVEQALKKAIHDVVSANLLDFDEFIRTREKPVHVVFIGINGTGKTTSIAKLTKRLQDSGYSVILAAGDTFRAGAIDQLEIHANRLGVKMIKHQAGADPAAVIYDAVQYAKSHKIDVVLSDTAGRMHTNVNLMVQMEKIHRVSSPDLVVFVDEAVAGNDAVERAAQFNEAVPIDGSILTKIDADSKGGAAISIAYITGKPILFFGIGQGYDDLKKFDPDWFVEKLFSE